MKVVQDLRVQFCWWLMQGVKLQGKLYTKVGISSYFGIVWGCPFGTHIFYIIILKSIETWPFTSWNISSIHLSLLVSLDPFIKFPFIYNHSTLFKSSVKIFCQAFEKSFIKFGKKIEKMWKLKNRISLMIMSDFRWLKLYKNIYNILACREQSNVLRQLQS